MLWNATSIQNKKSELQNFLIEHQVDIAIITETWLSPKNLFHLQHYNIRRKDWTVNPGESTRGGVMIATSNKIFFEDHTQPTSTEIENIAIKPIDAITPPHHHHRRLRTTKAQDNPHKTQSTDTQTQQLHILLRRRL